MDEIKQRLEELRTREFMLQMKDRWSIADSNLDRKLSYEIRELEKELEFAENK